MIIKYLLKKEFRQFIRNPFLPKLVVLFPIMIMAVIPWIVNMEIKNINITAVNQDGGELSERFIKKLESSSYFVLKDVVTDYQDALAELDLWQTDAIIEIPREFERNLMIQGNTPVQISINAVNETKGTLGSSYLSAICSEFSTEITDRFTFRTGTTIGAPKVNLTVQNRYNPYMDYRIFMIPAMMVVIFIMLGGFLPALNIVSEKENGTIEQINISPVSKFSFIFSKMIPYWIMGIFVLIVTMLLARFIYGLAPKGSIWIIFLFAALFIFAISGFGLIVSNYSDTMQQAMFVMFFFVLVFMLLSGLFTPVTSMPYWAQYFTYLNPPRYFIETMRLIYLKGGTLTDLRIQFWALVGFDVFFGIWAVASYRKRD